VADFQSGKGVVRAFYQALDGAGADVSDVIAAHVSSDYIWRGYHPFNELSAANLASEFWNPLRRALTSLQRREDIFFAGQNKLEVGGTWVVSMGHLMGLFDAPASTLPTANRRAFGAARSHWP